MTETDKLPPVSLDLETHFIQPGLLAPPPVCGSFCQVEEGTSRIVPADLLIEDTPDYVRRSELIVLANGAFDFGILAAYGIVPLADIFRAYEEGRVFDVQIAQALDAIAGGHLFKDPQTFGALYVNGKRSERYSLEACVKLVLGRDNAKENDFWRMRYQMLEKTPIELWPEEARQYPCDDVRNTMDVALGQLGVLSRADGSEGPYQNLHDMKAQAYTAWCLHLSSMWGIRTDKAAVAALEAKVNAAHEEAIERFTGVFLRAKDGSEEQALVKRAVARAYGATGACPVCNGSGKVTSASSGNPVTCRDGAERADWHPKGQNREAVSAFKKALKAGEIPTLVVSGGCDGTGIDLSSSATLPRTETGRVSTNRDALMESGDEVLDEYALVSENEKVKGTYLPFLLKGTQYPINVRSNVLVETGRTSYDGVIQQMPRKGGIRETIVPEPGRWLCSIDYSAIELCTLAQAQLDILGRSTMADFINDTKDPGSLHTAMGGRLLGASFEEMKALVKAGDKRAKSFRQAGKAANFGLPGGMGAATFVLAKRKRSEGTTWSPDGQVEYAGIRLCILMLGAERCGREKTTVWKSRDLPPTCVQCLECAEDLRAQWYAQWPEMKPYLDHASRLVDAGGEVTQLRSNRIRGGTTFTSAANGFFQGLAADGAKNAFRQVTREMYVDRDSPMFGARIAFFAHDEIVSSLKEATAHEAAYRMADVMVASMREYTPDVWVVAEPALMRRLNKDAEAAFDANGRLIPFEDALAAKAA